MNVTEVAPSDDHQPADDGDELWSVAANKRMPQTHRFIEFTYNFIGWKAVLLNVGTNFVRQLGCIAGARSLGAGVYFRAALASTRYCVL